MPQWRLFDLQPYEREIDIMLNKWLDTHPEIDMRVCSACLANILNELLKSGPTDFRAAILESLVRGEAFKLERKDNA